MGVVDGIAAVAAGSGEALGRFITRDDMFPTPVRGVDLPTTIQSCAHKRGEQRVGSGGTGAELRMGLGGNVIWVLAAVELNELSEATVRGGSADL